MEGAFEFGEGGGHPVFKGEAGVGCNEEEEVSAGSGVYRENFENVEREEGAGDEGLWSMATGLKSKGCMSWVDIGGLRVGFLHVASEIEVESPPLAEGPDILVEPQQQVVSKVRTPITSGQTGSGAGKKCSKEKDGRAKFRCDQCENLYFSTTTLKKHQRQEHGVFCAKYTGQGCYDCGKIFKTRLQWVHHRNRMHGKTGKPGGGKAGALKHMIVDQQLAKCGFPSDYFRCICGKTYRNRNSVNSHLHRANVGKVYQCDQCSSAFLGKSMLVTHYKKVHKIEPNLSRYTCTKCGLIGFETYADMKRHRESCSFSSLTALN